MDKISVLSIAQMTDMHLFANENQQLLGMPTLKSCSAVVQRLQEYLPGLDFLLLTGDLSNDGSFDSYGNLQNLLASLPIQTYYLPGNQDSSIAMEQVLNLQLFSRRKSFERGGWNFILLDSSVGDKTCGYLSEKTLSWLNSQLTILEKQPTLVALHHPPVLINSDWLDATKLENSEDLFAILDSHPQVKLVLFGHIHQEFELHRNGVCYLGTPSTCVQFQPAISSLTLDSQCPGFRLLKLYSNGSWETNVERVCLS